ncbi:MAG: LytTR family DNA-binding domain-containing protein [Pseudomonadota bacterium]
MTIMKRLLRIAIVTTPLTILFMLALTLTRYLDLGPGDADFGKLLHIYAIGVQPWYLAAPVIVLIGFNQASDDRPIFATLMESVILATAIGALHLLNLTFFMAPHFGTTIYEYLPTLGFRDWMWDILVFIVALLSGHLWGAIRRHREAAQPPNTAGKIMARSASRVDIVDIADVVAASSQGNYVALITDKRQFLHRTTLAEMKKHLANHGFVQVHRSHLVRADSIISVTRRDGRIKDIRISGVHQFPVSASNQDVLIDIMETDGIAA